MGMVVCALTVIASAVGCGGSHTVDEDAGLDGGPRGLDAGLDATTTSGPPDTGQDSPIEPPDAPPLPVSLTNEETCVYVDYGSSCRVACDLPPDVPIALGVEWTGPYCCNPWMPENRHEGFSDCRCIDGVVLCPRGISGGPLYLPSSTCEFCPGTPSGMLPGSGGHDGGPAPYDAGPSTP